MLVFRSVNSKHTIKLLFIDIYNMLHSLPIEIMSSRLKLSKYWPKRASKMYIYCKEFILCLTKFILMVTNK